jgi:hypothetical protein
MPILDLPPYVPSAGDGLPGPNTLFWDELSVPAGLEAVFEYNGLYMNVMGNTDRYEITEIDGTFDADIRDARQDNTEDDGETLQSAYYGGRTIVLTGTVKTFTKGKLRGMMQALKAAFSDLTQEYPLYFRTGDFSTDHFIMCKKSASATANETQQNNQWWREFQITLRASNPRFLSFYQKSIIATPPYNPTPLVPTFTAVNKGNYWADTKIRIYGPSVETGIINAATGATFTVSNVNVGYVEWDTAARTFLDNNGNQAWGLLDDDAQKIRLQGIGDPITTFATNPTGENGIFIVSDSPRVQMSWYDSWL